MSEDFFLLNGLLGNQQHNDNCSNNDNDNNNGPVGYGIIIALIAVMFLLVRCLL